MISSVPFIKISTSCVCVCVCVCVCWDTVSVWLLRLSWNKVCRLGWSRTHRDPSASALLLFCWFIYCLCIQFSPWTYACRPEEVTTSHHRWLRGKMCLLGVELWRNSGEAVISPKIWDISPGFNFSSLHNFLIAWSVDTRNSQSEVFLIT